MWSRPASDEHSEGTDVPTTDHIMSNHPDAPIDPPRVSGDDVPPAPRPKTPRQRASKVKVMAEPDVPHDDDVPVKHGGRSNEGTSANARENSRGTFSVTVLHCEEEAFVFPFDAQAAATSARWHVISLNDWSACVMRSTAD